MAATGPTRDAETAKRMRAALKQKFPGVRFSVQQGSYSLGASLDVLWAGGPSWAKVDALCSRFLPAAGEHGADSVIYHRRVARLAGAS